MHQSFHFWDDSQIDDVDQLILLIDFWVGERKSQLTTLTTDYNLQPFKVMAVTDRALDDLEKVCSVENQPDLPPVTGQFFRRVRG